MDSADATGNIFSQKPAFIILKFNGNGHFAIFSFIVMYHNGSYDIAIIGGGLAGLSLAIQCAGEGYKTALFERETYPFHKVCGEYISHESSPFLERLGVPLSQLALPQISQLTVSDVKGKAYHFPLDMGGFGISRYTLDNLLYGIAIRKGVAVFSSTQSE